MVYLLKGLHLYLGCTGNILHILFSTETSVTLLPNNPVVPVDTLSILPFLLLNFMPVVQFDILNLSNDIYKSILMILTKI